MMKLTLFSAWLALLCAPALAQTTVQVDNLEASLRSGWQTRNGGHMAGLQLTLAPGWKTYWRSPGEAGIPPLFNWSGSENVKSVRVHWPRPAVFETNGLQSIGYHDNVTLPLEVTAIDPAKPIVLRVQVELGICRDICLPATLDLSADLTAPGTGTSPIKAALAAQPIAAANAGLTSIVCAVDPIADGLKITAVMVLPALGAVETVAFETGQPDIWVAKAKTSRSGDTLTSVTEMVAPTGTPFALDRSTIRLTVIAKDTAVEILGCPAS